MSKYRKWHAFVSVSASGPGFTPILEEQGRYLRPRMAADLRYTTADVDYFADHWSTPGYDSVPEEHYIRVRNPSLRDCTDRIAEAGDWLNSHSNESDWDGGGLTLSFAGHGRDTDGALVLQDGELTSLALIDQLDGIARMNSKDKRLRVVLMLDSCYAGAFVTDFLGRALHAYDSIYPYYLGASCMMDEVAWEDTSLGHGLFTYCWSVRSHSIGSVGASGIQSDNSHGPALGIAEGAYGCSILTFGEQNPVICDNYRIEACGEDIPVLPVNDSNLTAALTTEEMRRRLGEIRDAFKLELQPFSRRVTMRGQQSDAEVASEIQTLVDFLRRHSNSPIQADTGG